VRRVRPAHIRELAGATISDVANRTALAAGAAGVIGIHAAAEYAARAELTQATGSLIAV
jgi:hypothetical protein